MNLFNNGAQRTAQVVTRVPYRKVTQYSYGTFVVRVPFVPSSLRPTLYSTLPMYTP
jgi:hypothetical protein